MTGPATALRIRPLVVADLDRVHRIEVVSSPDPWSRSLLAGELEGDRSDRHWLVAEARPWPGHGEATADGPGGIPDSFPNDGPNDGLDDSPNDGLDDGPNGGPDDGPGGPVVGFGGMLRVVDEAHVLNLAVEPAHRRRGIARRLLAALLLDVADKGAVAATLEVRSGNAAAIGLYRRFGFEVAGRRPRYYPDGGDAEIMWCHRIDRAEARHRFETLGRGAAVEGLGDRRG